MRVNDELLQHQVRSLINRNSESFVTDHDDANDYHRLDDWNYSNQMVNNNNNNNLKSPSKPKNQLEDFQPRLSWRNVTLMTLLHLFAFSGWFLLIRDAKGQTIFWVFLLANLGGFGVLAGTHRLWSHRSFKAHWTVRLALMLMQTLAFQNTIYKWVRDHRIHHKYVDSDADPHNATRGFFFAHIGWLLYRRHPLIKQKGQQIDLSDLLADPIVRFQQRFYLPLVLLLWGVIPVFLPYFLWKESLLVSIFANFFRYTLTLHHSWVGNSLNHYYGYQFYDKSITPRESYLVSYLTFGEGYHNYHHTFPWDYSASEFGWRQCFNLTTALIDFCAWCGLVWDRKVPSKNVVMKRAQRTGDLSIIPPTLDQQRKPVSYALEMFLGAFIGTWILWTSFILRYLFVKGEI